MVVLHYTPAWCQSVEAYGIHTHAQAITETGVQSRLALRSVQRVVAAPVTERVYCLGSAVPPSYQRKESPNIVAVLLKPVVDVFIQQIRRSRLGTRFLLRLLLFSSSFPPFLNLVVMPFHQPYDGNTWKSRFCLHQYVQVRQCQIGNYCAMSETSFIPLHRNKNGRVKAC